MTEPFVVVEVPPGAHRQDETLGTKFKFWYLAPPDEKILFKRGRDNEDWSEKIAAELAHRLELPAADVELASLEGTRGIVSPSFLARGEHLHHGNELLMGLVADYPLNERYHVGQHTLEAVFAALVHAGAEPSPHHPAPREGWTAEDQMVGYLMLDALIGNTDRHHENWAICTDGVRRWLAPTYDHASSLGRNEPDRRIAVRLSGADPRVTVESYAEKARSAFYPAPDATKPMSTLAAFTWAARRRPFAAGHWVSRLDALSEVGVESLFARIPTDRISALQAAFAAKLVAVNAGRLRAAVKELGGR